MPLEKMICGENYTTELLKDNVNGLIDLSSPLPARPSIVYIGDSVTEGESSLSAFSRIYGIQSKLKWKVTDQLNSNQGVGGDTSQDVLDRISTIGLSMGDIADVMVGINDVSANVPVSTYIENIKSITKYCFDYGAKLVVIRVAYPKFEDATTPWDSAQYELYNSYVSELEGILMDNVVVDSESRKLMDNSSLLTVDGTHLGIYGSLIFGGAQADFLNRIIPTIDIYNNLIGDNLFSNPLLEGATGSLGGVSSGVVSDGWTVGANLSGATVVCSKTSNVFNDGRESQTIAVSGVNQSSTSVAALKQTVSVPSTSTSDQYESIIRYRVTKSKGLSNITAKILNDVFESIGESKNTTEISIDNAFEGSVRTMYQSQVSNGITSFTAEFPLKFHSGEVDFEIHFGSPILRKIK